MLSSVELTLLAQIEQATLETLDPDAMTRLHRMITSTQDAEQLARIEAAADRLATLMIGQMQALLDDFGIDQAEWLDSDGK